MMADCRREERGKRKEKRERRETTCKMFAKSKDLHTELRLFVLFNQLIVDILNIDGSAVHSGTPLA